MGVRFFPAIVALVLVAISSVPWRAAADDQESAKDGFRTARREISSRLHHRDTIERVAAVRDLHNYPTVDAVKLLLSVGFKDESPEVRTAAYSTLLDFKDDEAIARYLFSTMSKDTRRGAASPTALPVLAVLMASKVPDVERDTATYLERQAATRDGLVLIESLADEIGNHGQAEDVALLEKLIDLPSFAHEFGLRRAVVQSLIKIHATESVGVLIGLLEKIQGEIRADIVHHLNDVTGEQLGMESAGWQDWWEDNEKTFRFAATPQRKDPNNPAPSGDRHGGDGRSGDGRTTSMYYGLSIYAQKLVFIIDTSGSMTGLRLMAAKRELMHAIDGLPADTQFSILAFNSQVYPWQRQLVPASASMKRSAARWVEMLAVGSHTASYDALEAGLRFDAEALYFLTDGEPHGGKVTAPAEIVTLITRANYTRRLSIYAIGVGVGAPGGIFDEFLSTLAKQNWGVYRRVDQ